MILVMLLILPFSVSCSGDGNMHLLEEDIAAALKSCEGNARRQRHTDRYSDTAPRIDGSSERNQYSHERRNTFSDKMNVLNGSYSEGSRIYDGGNLINNVPHPVHGQSYNNTNRRIKRSELLRKDTDQCLSQCVFANLHVVDIHGIPREAELWNKVQAAVTSQQLKAILRDQIRACFQDLQTESEDNGCSYSNKLEKCLMLRFSDRRVNTNHTTTTTA